MCVCVSTVVFDSGSRYEIAYPPGLAHFLERMAFQSSVNFSNREEIMQELERYGGICDCQATRYVFLDRFYASNDPVVGAGDPQ